VNEQLRDTHRFPDTITLHSHPEFCRPILGIIPIDLIVALDLASFDSAGRWLTVWRTAGLSLSAHANIRDKGSSR
jgi:hypothetical protein